MTSARRRALRWFWGLVTASILLMGLLYRTLKAEPGAVTGVVFFVVSLMLAVCAVQAVRVWLALEAPRRSQLGRRAERQ